MCVNVLLSGRYILTPEFSLINKELEGRISLAIILQRTFKMEIFQRRRDFHGTD